MSSFTRALLVVAVTGAYVATVLSLVLTPLTLTRPTNPRLRKTSIVALASALAYLTLLGVFVLVSRNLFADTTAPLGVVGNVCGLIATCCALIVGLVSARILWHLCRVEAGMGQTVTD